MPARLPAVSSAVQATASLLVQVAVDQEQAEVVRATVSREEGEVKVKAAHTQALADEAKADLDQALPAFNAAVDSLNALNKSDIVEIKSMLKPPPLVQMTMEVTPIPSLMLILSILKLCLGLFVFRGVKRFQARTPLFTPQYHPTDFLHSCLLLVFPPSFTVLPCFGVDTAWSFLYYTRFPNLSFSVLFQLSILAPAKPKTHV